MTPATLQKRYSGNMVRWALGTLLAGAGWSAMLLMTPVPPVSAQDQGVPVSGTIYGFYDYGFEGKGAWVGTALLKFGEKPTVVASFADRNTGRCPPKDNGAICGTETISLVFADGTLDVLGAYHGVPGPTPRLYTLHETGTVANGTGAYVGVTGHVVIKGPFVYPKPLIAGTVAPPWMAEVHGVVFGIR